MPNQSDMKVITTLTKEQINFLDTWANIIDMEDGEIYYCLPQWFKSIGNNEFEIFYKSELPVEMKEYLEEKWPEDFDLIHPV